jgi:hypothetical protein
VPLHCGVTKVPGDTPGIVLAGLRDTKLIKPNQHMIRARKIFSSNLRQHAWSTQHALSGGHDMRQFMLCGGLRISPANFMLCWVWRTFELSSSIASRTGSYSGCIVLECIPCWTKICRISEATCMKSTSRETFMCTEAIILVSESCHTCSSWIESTPPTARTSALTSSNETSGGTP